MTQLGETLYGVTSKGKIKTWSCNVGDNSDGTAILFITTQTTLHGKMIYREELITQGKNIGKSNETTSYEQAINEAESRYRKKIKKGYGLEIPTDLTQADLNSLGFPKPMLALHVDVVKKIEFPAFFQPKYDGHRAIVTRKDGEMIMYSRGGDRITTMQHILDYLSPNVEEGQFFDGELYVHGELLQKIGSLIKKYRKGISETVGYRVYDTIMDVPYVERYRVIESFLGEDWKTDAPALLAFTRVVNSMEEAVVYRDKAIADGYEGGMLRCPDEGYRAGFKSKTLIKLKVPDDHEFKIIGVVEGKDRNVNGVLLKVACFVCEIHPGGPTFDVTSMGDMHEKDRTWHNRESFLEKQLTVQHYGYTKALKPFHPVALQLREDI